MSDESRPGERRKREETLIEDYLTEREELASGPRFHVPPFTIKRIEGTKTTYFLPLGEDPESRLEKMRGEAAQPPAPAPKMAAERAPEPAKRQAPPAMARMMEANVPKALAALQERALRHASEEPAPQEENADEAAEPAPGPEEAGQISATEPPTTVPPEPKAAPEMPPTPVARPAPNVIDVPAARVKEAAEAVAGENESVEGAPGSTPPFDRARPVSFRRPFVKPDTFGTRKTGLPAIPRRISAKELIARLRVVKEGVETRDQIVQRISASQRRPEGVEEQAAASDEEAPAGEQAAGEEAAAATQEGAADEETEEASEVGAPAAAGPSGAERGGAGRLCPSCGTPISEKNRLLVCTDCGRQNCDTCGRYEKSHMKSDVFYEYQFDWPLCLTCYEKAYTIQRMLGRASVCYGNGNFSYAMWYANSALQQDQKSRYVPKINDLVEKIGRASKAAGERDREWRFARKQFARQPAEDPRWRQ